MSRPGAKRALVAYGTKHGSTREIAEAIAEELRAQGLDADCVEAGDVSDLDPYSTVVLGSAVYIKRWRRDAKALLKREGDALGECDLWVFSSGPCGEPDPDRDEAGFLEPGWVVQRAEELGAREHVVFGGRVPQDPSNFVERAMLKSTPEEFQDLRDWDEIRGWARKIAASA